MTMYLADRDLCPRCGSTVSYDYTIQSYGNPDVAYFTCDYANCEYWRAVEAPEG